MNRVPPSRVPGFQKAQVAEEKRAEDQAEADKQAGEKEHADKHEAHHAKKAAVHHAHHAHQAAKAKPNAPRPHGHHDPHEAAHAAHMAEALGWTPETDAEAAERKRDADEAHEEEQREQAAQNGQKRVGTTTYAATAANKAEAGHDNKKDGFQKPNTGQNKPQLNTKTAEPPAAVSAAKTVDAARAAAERMLASGKPLDAFALLQMAEPAGVLFKENESSPFEAAPPEDPELAKAIEELINKLFGVKGILRVGGGRNKDDEPVVVVAVGNGFGEASLRAVPEKAGKFSTLIALPYDILPLKKER